MKPATLQTANNMASARLAAFFNGQALEFSCGTDQVGSLKTLSIGNKVVKQISYDSFGNIMGDTWADLFLPLGFAGGRHPPV